MSLLRRFLLPLLIALGASAAAAPFSAQTPPGFSASADFLPVDEAFVVGVSLAPSPQVFWQIHPGYYLYRGRLAFALEGAPEARLDTSVPSGLAKEDPYFGSVEVFYNDLSVALSIEGPVPEDATLRVSYQGLRRCGALLSAGDPVDRVGWRKRGNRHGVRSRPGGVAQRRRVSDVRRCTGRGVGCPVGWGL